MKCFWIILISIFLVLKFSESEKVATSGTTNKLLSTAWRRASHEIHNYYIYFISLSDNLETSYVAFTNALQSINEKYPNVMTNQSISGFYLVINDAFDSSRISIGSASKIVEKAMEFYEKYVSFVYKVHNQIFKNIRTSISPQLTKCTLKHFWNLSTTLESLFLQEGNCYLVYVETRNQFIEKMNFQLSELQKEIVTFSNQLTLCSIAINEDEALTCTNKVISHAPPFGKQLENISKYIATVDMPNFTNCSNAILQTSLPQVSTIYKKYKNCLNKD